MNKIKNILFCPWVEEYVPSEVWNEIESKIEWVRSVPMVNGLTDYQLLDRNKHILFSFQD